MELALVLVFVLIPLLIGIADIGRAYYEHLAVVHAADVGARWATLSGQEQAEQTRHSSALAARQAQDSSAPAGGELRSRCRLARVRARSRISAR